GGQEGTVGTDFKSVPGSRAAAAAAHWPDGSVLIEITVLPFAIASFDEAGGRIHRRARADDEQAIELRAEPLCSYQAPCGSGSPNQTTAGPARGGERGARCGHAAHGADLRRAVRRAFGASRATRSMSQATPASFIAARVATARTR